MNKSEEKLTSRELKKAKIRERYKGINQDEAYLFSVYHLTFLLKMNL